MAQKIQVTVVCDLCDDGKPGSDSVAFGLEGASYEIDLCDRHAKQMRDAVAPFVGAARRVSGGRRVVRRAAPAGTDRERTQAIRAWARKKGLKVSERGRISADIVAQYDAAKGR